jgi:hypothetical protein
VGSLQAVHPALWLASDLSYRRDGMNWLKGLLNIGTAENARQPQYSTGQRLLIGLGDAMMAADGLTPTGGAIASKRLAGLLEAQTEAEKEARALAEEKSRRDRLLHWAGTNPNLDANQMAEVATMAHALGPEKAAEEIFGTHNLAPGGQLRDRFGAERASAKTSDVQTLEQLMAMREMYPEGSTTRRWVEQAIERETAQKAPLVQVGGEDPYGWKPLGTSGQFARTNPASGMPEVMAAPGSTASSAQLDSQQERVQRQEQRRGRAETVAPTVMRDIARAMELADHAGPFAGAVAEYAGKEPESLGGALLSGATRIAAADPWELNKHMESIKSNISIDALQQMREMSPTGGALGQVPVQQQVFLMQLLGNLSASMPPDALKENLANIHNEYVKSVAYAQFGSDGERKMLVERGEMSPQEAAALAEQYEKYVGEN